MALARPAVSRVTGHGAVDAEIPARHQIAGMRLSQGLLEQDLGERARRHRPGGVILSARTDAATAWLS